MIKIVIFLGLVQLALVGATVLDDVDDIESELKEDKGSENVQDTDEVRLYLEQYHNETCQSFLTEKYDEYFTPNAVFNIEGEKYQGKQDFQQNLNGLECKMRTYAVWDVEKLGDHAIATVKFNAESDIPMSGVVIQELVKENGMWKTELVLDFGHVDFSSDGNGLNSDETEIYEFLKMLFNQACTTPGETGYESEVNEKLCINAGGRKLLSGLDGTREALRILNSTRCDMEDFKIIDVEVGSDAAIALVTGHFDVDKKRHPFLEAFQFQKDSEAKWTMDTSVVFLHVSGL